MTDGPLLFAQDQERDSVRVRRTTYYSLGGPPLVVATARAEVIEALRRLTVDSIAVMPGPAEILRWTAEILRWTPPRRKRKKGWRYASDHAVAAVQGEIFRSDDQARVMHETGWWRRYRRDA